MSERPPDSDELSEVRALVLEIYEGWTPAQGKKSWAAFARYAGVSEYSLAEWRSGRGAPSAANLLLLLNAVGRIEPNGEAHVAQPAPVAIMQEALQNQREMLGRLEALGDALANLEQGQAEILRALPAQKATRPKPAADAPKRQR